MRLGSPGTPDLPPIYVMACHQNTTTGMDAKPETLWLALSGDAKTFSMLGDTPVYTPPAGDHVRDPSIKRYKGAWYVAHTTDLWTGSHIHLLRSTNLVDWMKIADIEMAPEAIGCGQKLDFGGSVTGGTFTLSIANKTGGGTSTTAALARNITNANLKAAVEGLLTAAGYTGITVAIVSGGPCPTDVVIAFQGSAATGLPLMTATSSLTGTNPTLAVVSVPETVTYCWGPELFIEDDGTMHCISSVKTNLYPYHRPIHHVATNASLTTWSSGTIVQGDWGAVNCIDFSLVKWHGRYYLFYNLMARRLTFYAVADAIAGPYVTPAAVVDDWAGWRAAMPETGMDNGIEGPCIIRMNGFWRAYIDNLGRGMYYSDSYDWPTGNSGKGTWTVPAKIACDYTPVNMSVIAITDAAGQAEIIANALGYNRRAMVRYQGIKNWTPTPAAEMTIFVEPCDPYNVLIVPTGKNASIWNLTVQLAAAGASSTWYSSPPIGKVFRLKIQQLATDPNIEFGAWVHIKDGGSGLELLNVEPLDSTAGQTDSWLVIELIIQEDGSWQVLGVYRSAY